MPEQAELWSGRLNLVASATGSAIAPARVGLALVISALGALATSRLRQAVRSAIPVAVAGAAFAATAF